MKSLFVIAALALAASNVAWAANATCEAQATDKKLAGAAKSSFTKKCVTDAGGEAS